MEGRDLLIITSLLQQLRSYQFSDSVCMRHAVLSESLTIQPCMQLQILPVSSLLSSDGWRTCAVRGEFLSSGPGRWADEG